MGRLSCVTVGEETTRYEYDPNGRRYRVTYPDGTTETYVYNKNNQVTRLINATANGAILSAYQYTYDAAGNQLTKQENKGTTRYEYDRLNRLCKVTEPEGKETAYTYDGAGNRKTEKVTIDGGAASSTTLYAYNEQNRLTFTRSSSGEETTYVYDKNGNLISKSVGVAKPLGAGAEKGLPGFGLVIRRDSEEGTGSKDLTLYTYDKYNRLTRMRSEDTTATYRYNAQGYRTEKTVNGATTRYLYEGDKVVLETDKTNNQKAFQVYGTNLLYRAVAKSDGIEAEEYYYLYNAHGDVTGLIDAKGNIAATYDYDAFGNIISETGSANNNIKYAGYQHDKETGLYYLNARYYDSTIARFITEDTFRGQKNDPLSLNLYTYCHNEPIRYIDPSGHSAQDFLMGMSEAILENICDGFVVWVAEKIRGKKANDYQYENELDFYFGRVIGDALSMLGGTGAILKGIATVLGSGIGGASITVGSGGTLILAGGAIAYGGIVAGTAEVSVGGATIAAASDNFGYDIKRLEELIKEGKSKTVDDIIQGAKETTNGKGVAKNFEKSGGYSQTVKDFESLNPTNVKEIQTKYGTGYVGTLSDGTTVVARPGSTTGGATLEINISNSKVYKIRY